MKAIRVEQFGGPEVLRVTEVPQPECQEGEVIVRMKAAGVNPVETYIRSGNYGRLPTPPYTPGTDGAGTVEKVGGGVTNFQPGDRVYVAGSRTGTYAEQCAASTSQVHRLPDRTPFEEGADLGIPYATAYRALFQRGGAVRGETVLIHGATGAVGTAALQFAKAAGLTVLATGGTDVGRLLAFEQGAEKVFDHHEMGYAEQVVAETGGRGVNLIVEMLANVNLAHDLAMLCAKGRVVIVGSRGTVEINPRDLMTREADIRGVMLFASSPKELSAAHNAIYCGLEAGTLRPIVTRQMPLERASEAHEAVMQPGAQGKIVLTI